MDIKNYPKFWANIIENSPDAIVAIRKGGEIIIFNRAAEKLLGYRKDEVIGRMNITGHLPFRPGQDDHEGPAVRGIRRTRFPGEKGIPPAG